MTYALRTALLPAKSEACGESYLAFWGEYGILYYNKFIFTALRKRGEGGKLYAVY